MAIADIQITPPVLHLDPATRKGRFSVSVANQLGRDGRLLVSVIPMGDARPEWFRLEERYRELAVKKDETAVFDVEVTVSADVAAQTYTFKLQVADNLDPVNVRVESEPRDFVVVAALPPPPPPAWRRWAIIGGAAVVLIGGGIALALVLTGDKTKDCKPACAAGSKCVAGACQALADAGAAVRDAVAPHGDGCDPREGRPCGDCRGTIQCNGTCSKPTPPNFGQPCHQCGQRIDCDGRCPPPPPGFGATCNACGGKRDCAGACLPALPPDYGQVRQFLNVVKSGNIGEIALGGPCSANHEFAGVAVSQMSGTLPCALSANGSGRSCAVRVRFPPTPPLFPPSACRVIINERRVCDPVIRVIGGVRTGVITTTPPIGRATKQ